MRETCTKTSSIPAIASVALTLGAILLALLFLEVCSLGIGGWTVLFHDPTRRDAALGLLALAALTPLCGCHITVGRRKNHSNDWVLPALLFAGLALGYFSARADRTSSLSLSGESLRYVGLLLFLTGFVLRILAIRSLGDRFTVWVTIHDDHELVTDRLYRYLRHPSYTGVLLTLLGWALVFRSLTGVLIALAMGLLLITRMDAEEELLVVHFPDEYPEYIERTWRLVPFVY
jgi:protein-S-isoprenylcysteine O-methyltransferase Ste14